MHSQTTHASLLTRVGALSDEAAWRQFCGTYGGMIRAMARRCGLPLPDCDDVAQSVLARLVRVMPSFEYRPQRGRFRGYLKTVVIREVARARTRARRVAAIGAELGAEATSPAALDAVWESEWRQHHVRRALRRVEHEFSGQDVEAFRQYALRDADARLVAVELGLTTHQVYKAKTRILQRLREVVQEQIALEQ